MTVFSLSSMELVMMLLATRGAARDSFQIMKSGGTLRVRLPTKNGGELLTQAFRARHDERLYPPY
jgi:hypothetical protein